MSDYNYLVKTLLVGDHKSGKSSLLLRYAEDAFKEQAIPTIGVDFKIKQIRCGKEEVKLQIWDTAGQERFRAITSAYYRGAGIVFLTYDTSASEDAALDSLNKFNEEVKKYCSDNVIVIVLGCKSDLQNPSVVQVGKTFAERQNYSHLLCSAKTSEGVDEAFHQGVSEWLDKNKDSARVVPPTKPSEKEKDQKKKLLQEEEKKKKKKREVGEGEMDMGLWGVVKKKDSK